MLGKTHGKPGQHLNLSVLIYCSPRLCISLQTIYIGAEGVSSGKLQVFTLNFTLPSISNKCWGFLRFSLGVLVIFLALVKPLLPPLGQGSSAQNCLPLDRFLLDFQPGAVLDIAYSVKKNWWRVFLKETLGNYLATPTRCHGREKPRKSVSRASSWIGWQ